MTMIFSIGAARTTVRTTTKNATDDADFSLGLSLGDALAVDTGYLSLASMSISHLFQTSEPLAGALFGILPAVSTGGNEGGLVQGVAFDGVVLHYTDFVQSTVVAMPSLTQGVVLTNYILDSTPLDDAPVNANGRFDIVIRYSGDAAYASYFQAAAVRWAQIITGDIPDAVSGDGTPVDDLLIDASVAYIDGAGSGGRNILGQAGPDWVRLPSYMPVHGVMTFDSYDLSFMVNQGILDEVILHEMGHVIGVGTIWPYVGLRTGDANYYGFTGSNALAEYKAMSGNLAATSVPVQPGSVAGSSGAHWSESVFQNELMTPTTGPGNVMPISRLTIASLADLGYAVNLAAADVYSFPGGGGSSAPDDFADSFLDRSRIFGLVNVGGTSGGTLEAAGDRDWFTVQLTAGVNYAINLTGTGALNPYLRFYGNTGVLIAENNDITPGVDLNARLTFRPTTTGTYYIEASAFGDNATGTYFLTANSIANQAPQISLPSGANVTASAPGQSIAFASLFIGSDADNDPLTYYLYDGTAAANSGHWVVNGAVVAAGVIYQVSAAQLALTSFVTGASGTADELYVQDFDGQAYSGWNAHVHVAVPSNSAPTISLPSGPNVTASAPGQSMAFSSLFSGSDADNDPLTYYLYDGTPAANSGHWVVNGTTVAAGVIYQVSAAQLAQTSFVTGASGTADDLYVQDFDGQTYSGWNAHVHVAVPNNSAPTISLPSGPNVTASTSAQSIAFSSLFSGSDADNDPLTYYLYDGSPAANSGHWVVNGAIVAAETIYQVSAAQLAQTSFVTGASATADELYVQDYDGKAYSGWNAHVQVAVPNTNAAPTISLPSGTAVQATAAQSLAASGLFSGSDVNGDTLSYYVYDSNAAGNSGHFEINGTTVPALTITQMTAAQLAQTTFVAGAAGTTDYLYAEAFDGQAYSSWIEFHVFV
ncbi:MAG: pilin protein MshA [Bradyrhizobium sp.]|nr:pilin protein MshA [Bradyrhizobium sp.]